MDEKYDYCYGCTGYGDEYYYNEDGELVCLCDNCPYNGSDLENDWVRSAGAV